MRRRPRPSPPALWPRPLNFWIPGTLDAGWRDDGQVKTQDLAANSVTSSKIADGTIAVGDLGADSVGSGQLQTNSVGATEIADATIDSGEIIDNSLLAADLASGSVGNSEVADGSLTGNDIANNSISTADLVGSDASGSISLGAGSIAQGRCTNFSIAVPGALTSQTVIISARATLASGGILYGVGVPSNDTVTMAACNFTGGSFPALSSFPIRTVTFG